MAMFNGTNYFNEKSFNQLCERLEAGEELTVYISCIGFTRANIEGHAYRRALEKRYGDRLEMQLVYSGNYDEFSYKLKK